VTSASVAATGDRVVFEARGITKVYDMGEVPRPGRSSATVIVSRSGW
jgi:hypothetical protein